jgi:hypothetical protein
VELPVRGTAARSVPAALAREVGATWDEILGSIMLTTPGLGLLPAAEAIPHARAGFDAARETGRV